MSKQMVLNIYRGKRGGRRPGAGRKRIKSAGVAHRRRQQVLSRYPLHINFKLSHQLRNKQCLGHLKRAIINARSHGLRIVHFSLQSNHVHLIVEASSNKVLTKSMRSLTVTFAKALRKGKVQLERYHLHVLRTLRETRNAILYVVFNEQKHSGQKFIKADEYSSLRKVNLKLEAMRRGLIIGVQVVDLQFLDPGNWLSQTALSSHRTSSS